MKKLPSHLKEAYAYIKERSLYLTYKEAKVLAKLIKVGRANTPKEEYYVNTFNIVENRVGSIIDFYEVRGEDE